MDEKAKCDFCHVDKTVFVHASISNQIKGLKPMHNGFWNWN